jgi:AGZA family xanthine/uracil permease-like MFS transporter
VRGTPNSREDVALSERSGEADWKYRERIGSNGSHRELETVIVQALPTDPRHEKVFAKMGVHEMK